VRSDERIVDDLNERLMNAHDIDVSDVEVRCEGGKIVLEGNVDQRWMKHRVEDIAESCAGVRDIDNRIRVATGNSSLSSSQRGATTASGALGGQSASSSSSSSLGSASTGSDDAARLASSTTAKSKDASSTRTGASGTTGSSGSQH
jgi:hypothetical protein